MHLGISKSFLKGICELKRDHVGEEQAELEGGVKCVISLKSLCCHKSSPLPPWIPLTFIKCQFSLYSFLSFQLGVCYYLIICYLSYYLVVSMAAGSWCWKGQKHQGLPSFPVSHVLRGADTNKVKNLTIVFSALRKAQLIMLKWDKWIHIGVQIHYLQPKSSFYVGLSQAMNIKHNIPHGMSIFWANFS